MASKKLKITICGKMMRLIREMYKLKLEAAGFDVSTANDGASGFACF